MLFLRILSLAFVIALSRLTIVTNIRAYAWLALALAILVNLELIWNSKYSKNWRQLNKDHAKMARIRQANPAIINL